MVIGHELTHGFDDEGRQFDPQGNLRDWWTATDAKAFEERAACIADEYSNFSVAPGVNLNGKLTLGENTADNGGVRIALMALMNTMTRSRRRRRSTASRRSSGSSSPSGRSGAPTIAKRRSACRCQVDPHSPARFRVNGVVQNMPEFQKAFSCKPGQPMVRPTPAGSGRRRIESWVAVGSGGPAWRDRTASDSLRSLRGTGNKIAGGTGALISRQWAEQAAGPG